LSLALGQAICANGGTMSASSYAQPSTYTPIARLLHWLTAVLVLTLIVVGIVMANMEDGPTKNFLYNLHRSTGALVLVLVLVRLIYRLTHPVPPLPADMPGILKLAARANHWAFYALLIIQPLLGWIATSAYRAPILFFWLFELPPIWPENRAFSEQVFAVHRFIGVLIAVLVCVHVAGALYHHFIRRDGVLLRMLSGTPAPASVPRST
jgi:cytochrome b561